ncbi:hypothetical protein ACVWWO_003000 [Bradyrhizobium sp. F1.13.1]
MNKALTKHVFHEVHVADIAFRAALDQGMAVLHVEDAVGRQTQIYLMGSGLPSLFHADFWTISGRALGRGWALCHDTSREPLMHLGELNDSEIARLVREFGLHVDLSHEVVTFAESAAARSLKRIVAEDPDRAGLFRKKAKWLDGWLSKVPSDAPQLSVSQHAGAT